MSKKEKTKKSTSQKDINLINSQKARYDEKSGKPVPDNNVFWENNANPLSSKGN